MAGVSWYGSKRKMGKKDLGREGRGKHGQHTDSTPEGEKNLGCKTVEMYSSIAQTAHRRHFKPERTANHR